MPTIMRVVFLGTGAAVPTIRRGLSSVAIVRDGEVLLADCGEGTQIQIQRTSVRPGKISTILVSHLHGDHVTGIPGLLMSLQMADHESPVDIFGPKGLRDYVQLTMRNLRLRPSYQIRIEEIEPGWTLQRSGYRLESIELDHSVLTLGYGLFEDERPGRFQVSKARDLQIPEGPLWGRLQRGESIETPDGRTVRPEQVLGESRRGRSLVYATDTGPLERVARFSEGADLLIHDGTFGADATEMARSRRHSTSVDAANIASSAGVGRLALTHVSARYTNDRQLLHGATRVFPNTFVARDLMELEIPLPD